ncbi:MAG: type II secretion system minor pseudopilin GspJ [Burkholderiales bacterium]|nr:type II secretion system minor pseudopilin GspJ [Burkholderiales bacterium]
MHNTNLPSKYRQQFGFTLIELMVAVIIFAFISVVSYRIITSLVTTKEVAGAAQTKWGDLSLLMSNFGGSWNRVIPLVARDQDGNILPAVLGSPKLKGMYDSQLELTLSGFVGDQVYGTSPPKRVGYRFYNGSLYLVTWPALNRVLSTQPVIDLLIGNVQLFEVVYLYPDNQWRDSWPPVGGDPTVLPTGIKFTFQLKTGEKIERSWAL